MSSYQTLSVKDLAEILQLSPRTIHNRISAQTKAIEAGESPESSEIQRLAPPSIKLGRSRLFIRETVEQWLSRFEGVEM